MLQFPVASMPPSSYIAQPLCSRLHLNLFPNFFPYQNPTCSLFSSKMARGFVASRIQSRGSVKLRAQNQVDDLVSEENVIDWDDQEQGQSEDEELPWKEAIVYKRNPSISHLEYCTTLERLGLGKLSTDISKSHASMMGIRVTNAVKVYPHGTPVLISLDVTRKKQRLRLDGILRTIITLGCNRCGEVAPKTVFSNFSLLLSEEPIEEPDTILINLFSDKEEKATNGYEEEDEDDSIDFDDRLYFPINEKEIDISKNIRDLIHVEITIAEVCDPKCKGLCLECGENLNDRKCKCGKRKVVEKKGYGPLGGLKKQMQQK